MDEKKYSLSVIIPSYNRRDTLTQVLYALENQDYPLFLFQVVVVDDASTDGTAEFLDAFRKATLLEITVVSGPGINAAAARNRGLEHAVGEIVLFLDADTIPQSDVVKKHIMWHRHYGEGVCLIGNVAMSEVLATTSQARLNETQTQYDTQEIAEIAWQEYRTANTSLHREVCTIVRGFDESLPAAEDTEFASRLAETGLRFIFIRDIKVVHHHPMTRVGFFRKGTLYGQAVAGWYSKAPKLRGMLVQRYGVYAPEMSRVKKMEYGIRVLLINRLTIPLLIVTGAALRSFRLQSSDLMYRCIFRYHVRQAFRTRLKQV